jgi:hypothetical protein
MKYPLALLLVLPFFFNVNGQSPPGRVIKARKGVDENCIYINKYSEAARSKFYPFNVSDTIMLVSFNYHKNNYPIDQHSISYDSLIERRVLNKAEVAQLTDILYNNVAKKHGNIGAINQCFFPRNAILFIDKTGKLREYVLLCFHCKRYESSYDKIERWDSCYQKFEMIYQFFISTGIKFGTDPTIDIYPGESPDE